MRSKEFYYDLNNKRYLIHVDYKTRTQRSNYYRKRGDTIFVSVNSRTSEESIIKSLQVVIPKLEKACPDEQYFTDKGVYIFGDFVSTEDGFVKFAKISFLFLNQENFYKQLKKYAKSYFEERVAYYSKLMGVKTKYKVSLKKVVSRYGSNSSRTNTLSFNLILVHYSKEIIDSVIVHELAHDFYRDHSDNFYNVVYRYCPNYDLLDKKLRKGILK